MTSQWAVSRRRVAKPEKLAVSEPCVQRMYWRGRGGSDGSSSGCFQVWTGWPVRRSETQSARSRDAEDLGRRGRDQAVAVDSS